MSRLQNLYNSLRVKSLDELKALYIHHHTQVPVVVDYYKLLTALTLEKPIKNVLPSEISYLRKMETENASSIEIPGSEIHRLDSVEVQILNLLCSGYTSKQISTKLRVKLTDRSVETKIGFIRKKLNARNNPHLVYLLSEKGLLVKIMNEEIFNHK